MDLLGFDRIISHKDLFKVDNTDTKNTSPGRNVFILDFKVYKSFLLHKTVHSFVSAFSFLHNKKSSAKSHNSLSRDKFSFFDQCLSFTT